MLEKAQNSSGTHARSSTPPKSLKKPCFSKLPQQELRTNINISFEVSSTLFVLQHLCTNIKISLPEITISRRRPKTTMKIAKPTFHETIKTAADQWTTTDKSYYSYSNASTVSGKTMNPVRLFRCYKQKLINKQYWKRKNTSDIFVFPLVF